MEAYKEQLSLLLQLQDKDTVLDEVKGRAEAIPAKIAELKAQIDGSKSSYDEIKKDVTQLQVLKRQKELEVETQEGQIRKHSTELNSVKSNDAYKGLLKEIDHCKEAKNTLENEILEIMEKIDTESVEVKDKEKNLKQDESAISTDITQLEAELLKVNAELAKIQEERQAFAAGVPENVMHKYEYIHRTRSGKSIVAVEGEMCSGCNMSVRPAVINEIFKEQEFIMCDSCSRLLYKK